MEIREGQFWKRKLSGFVWQVEAVNPGGTIAIKLWDEIPDHELLTQEEFLERFTPYDRQG
jgi:hypothetical protein